MEKLYYSISEVAGILGENASLVRFWSNSFPKYIKPYRNAKGNRMFKVEDIETLKQIHYLVKEKGYTLEGAAKFMSDKRGDIDKSVKVLDSLKQIREQLAEVRNSL